MNGARAQIAALAEQHRREILNYLVRLLGNRADAEDACQEVFLRAQRGFAALAPGSNRRAWLYRIATNSGLNAARRQSRLSARRLEIDVDSLPARNGQPADRGLHLQSLARAVRRLPARQRAALMLRQFEGLSYAEIALCVGGTEAGARANVYQALKNLRAALEGER